MKLTLFLLLLPITAFSQTIKFYDGAGINPRHIESIGNDAGWVEIQKGPMATGGQVFKIMLDDWIGIDTIYVKMYTENNVRFGAIIPRSRKQEHQWVGIIGVFEWSRFEYTAKRKKA